MNEETLERDLRPPNELVEVICFSAELSIPIQSFRETLLYKAAPFLFLHVSSLISSCCLPESHIQS